MGVGKHGSEEFENLAKSGVILQVLTGSATHGISTESSDRDEVGICVEPPDYVVGLRAFEQYEYRTAAERTGRFDAPSEPGDLDLKIYSLRKFMRLALNGNPSIIEILYVTHLNSIVWTSKFGRELQAMAPRIVSREAGPKYLGYLHAQRRSMQSNNGKGRDITRPELVEKYGYDTKYAGHMIRLGLQGCELLATGAINLPMRPYEREMIRAIRTGHWTMESVLAYAEELENDIKALMTTTGLPRTPDRAAIDTWLLDTYAQCWAARGLLPEWL